MSDLVSSDIRDDFVVNVSLFHSAVDMRRAEARLDNATAKWEIAYEAGLVFCERAAFWLQQLNGMAGEW